MFKFRKGKTRANKGQPLPLCYPFDWNGLENFDYPLDDLGVPQVWISRRSRSAFADKKAGLRYNPITIAQFGLFHLQKYSANRKEMTLRHSLDAARWLVENFHEWRNGVGAWVYDFDLDFYGPKAPWISGMAQGQGMSLLLRVHQLRPDEQVLEICRRAFRSFLQPVAQGGVCANFPDGATAFEEFPTNPPSLVLNGHIFALLGVYDYAQFFGDQIAKQLFEETVSGLKRNLRRYDTGFWNRYDLHPTNRLASPMYVRVHVQLLNILAELTGDPFFQNYAAKWQGYLHDPLCRARWLLGKTVEKIRLRL